MYVNFEKLYATMDQTYNHQDDSKDFVGGFALVWKDVVSSKKMVRTEESGLECLKLGDRQWWIFSLIDLWSLKGIEPWSSSYFTQHLQNLKLPFNLTWTQENFIHEALTIWTTILVLTSLYFPRCSIHLKNVWPMSKLYLFQKGSWFHVKIGMLAYVWTPVLVGASTVISVQWSCVCSALKI